MYDPSTFRPLECQHRELRLVPMRNSEEKERNSEKELRKSFDFSYFS